MKLAVICFTLTGFQTAQRIRQAMETQGHTVLSSVKSRYFPDSVRESVGEWTGKQFECQDAILFVGAAGIAVRSIAPYIVSKKSDPAILVIDECGKFVISLMSGHLGGANELALKLSEILEAVPVVTTATDLHGRFAVDVFAKKNHCEILFMKAAKEVSAALLHGETAGFYSDDPVEGELPVGLILCNAEGVPVDAEGLPVKDAEQPRVGVAVTIYKNVKPFEETTVVVPKKVIMGVGCRKGKAAEDIKNAAEECLSRASVYQEALLSIASIDLKKEEAGLLAVSGYWKVPFATFSAEELMEISGEFTPSMFVRSITGVENVCERSAVKGSGGGRLIQRKHGENGVTTALAVKEGGLQF